MIGNRTLRWPRQNLINPRKGGRWVSEAQSPAEARFRINSNGIPEGVGPRLQATDSELGLLLRKHAGLKARYDELVGKYPELLTEERPAPAHGGGHH
ncbi:MAG: hypothetical protein HY917_00925 [Candidatus Diapherotrites archaeon]|nr:hypothetical protein [Candidatus Diapherotrites archaeon]